MDKIIGIYLITCLDNNRFYVGRALSISTRWNEHRRELRHNKHINKELQEDWNRYGEDSFSFEIVEEGNKKDYKYRELFWIDNFKVLGFDLYNVPSISSDIVFFIGSFLEIQNIDFEVDYKNLNCIGKKSPLNFNLHIVSEEKEIYVNLYNNRIYVENSEEFQENNMKRKSYINSCSDYSYIHDSYNFGTEIDEMGNKILNKIMSILWGLDGC